MKAALVGLLAGFSVMSAAVAAQSPGKGMAAIQWYSTLRSGVDEAKKTGRPILFISAAPHCAGVSGIW